MSTLTRIKQALMAVGLLTVLGILAMAGLVVYLWWDARGEDEFEADTDFEPGTDVDTDFETGAGDGTGVDASDDGADVGDDDDAVSHDADDDADTADGTDATAD